MMSIMPMVEVSYSIPLMLLSIAVAIFASYVALNLAYSVTNSQGRAHALWLASGALAMGVGIWSMHFIGMLACEMPGMEMAYDVPLMLLSILVAIAGSGLALFVVSRSVVPTAAVVASGIAMAVAISGMHYIGMYSMRMSARIEWNLWWVCLSILIALVASFAALGSLIRLRNQPDRVSLMGQASVILGIAIAGMHYTGMIGAKFVHDHKETIADANLLVTDSLAIWTVFATLLILGVALVGSVGQRMIALRRKTSKDRLERSETKYRMLVEAVKDYAIFMLDTEGRITTWNIGAQRITGYSPQEIIGKHVSTLYPDRDHHTNSQTALNELVTVRETGHFEGEAVRRRKDGTEFWANIVLDPLMDEDGTLTGYSKVVRDVTATRTLNEELERRVRERTEELIAAKEAAEVANRTKSAFLANMSHEIRTPLGAVIGFSELMLNGEVPPNEHASTIEIIKRNGKLLSTIINDILDLSKVEAGKLEIERTEVRLDEFLKELAILLNLDATAKGIQLKVSTEGIVPLAMKTDPLRLKQILFNIVGNAIKFTERGTVSLKARIFSEDAKKIEFVVQDTGAGISPEQAERLFSPFTQADATTTRRFGGTGLGLVLSKKLAEALGGDVVLVQSTPGQGSVFQITIAHGQANEIFFESNEGASHVSAQ